MIEVNNLTDYSIDKKFLRELAFKILKKESSNCFEKKDLSIALVVPLRIKELNKRYRKKNRPTDVLSFQDKENWGEIIICPVEVKKNTKKFNSNFKKELSRVLIHGVLHLLGYDHEKDKEEEKMKKKEEYYLNI
ncbi:MAG: rRNA maturation RNase YbeY [Candidatus Nealsonbacteria bacterium]|nr:rRNA maturation RNase YbeY [Candidatus Nealsonbacteria bacterium]